MGLFDDIFGGGGGGDLPQISTFSENPTSTPGSNAFTNFDTSSLGTPSQNTSNPTSTPGMGGSGGFDWASFGSSFGSPTQHSQNPVSTPGVTPNPQDFTSTGTLPMGSAGGTNSPLSPISAIANGLNGGGITTDNSASAAPAAATGGTPGATPGATKPPTSSGGILQTLGLGNTGVADLLKGGVAGGGLLYNLLEGSPSASAEKSLKNIAGQQTAQGQQLESYIANGTLPPGAQQWVNQQTAGQKAAIRSKYAQLGMNGSTAEQQELSQVDAAATSQMFTIASQLLNTGVNETNASGTLYNYLLQAQNADAKDMSSAIQNFVASLGGSGSGGGTTIKIGS